MTDDHSQRTSYDNESYQLTYCEDCGTITSGSPTLVDELEEPVIRVGILETVNQFAAYDNVAETVATEEDECRCGGIIVKRYYACGKYPEPEYEPDEDELREAIREHRDSIPECDCGETMDATYSRLATVVRCPTGECRCEGAMGPYWLRRLLPWNDVK